MSADAAEFDRFESLEISPSKKNVIEIDPIDACRDTPVLDPRP